ncbi:hypothetical protein GRF29_8g1420989 [Pseudopithomyces chartarum]|uniref:Uncharacterized protein n=1 Tax=Pseudopithomyces chartarum TaxID=1892770 RepID=A0AAN6M7S1_9PLEO|nr:hypothetical protein GRF29_8g1420989 [Pseudopithomyces chartarum]
MQTEIVVWRSGSAVKEQITDYFLGNPIQHVQAGSSAPVIRWGAMFTRMETRGCSDSPTMVESIGSPMILGDNMAGLLYPCVGLYGGVEAVGTIVRANFQAQWDPDCRSLAPEVSDE